MFPTQKTAFKFVFPGKDTTQTNQQNNAASNPPVPMQNPQASNPPATLQNPPASRPPKYPDDAEKNTLKLEIKRLTQLTASLEQQKLQLTYENNALTGYVQNQAQKHDESAQLKSLRQRLTEAQLEANEAHAELYQIKINRPRKDKATIEGLEEQAKKDQEIIKKLQTEIQNHKKSFALMQNQLVSSKTVNNELQNQLQELQGKLDTLAPQMQTTGAKPLPVSPPRRLKEKSAVNAIAAFMAQNNNNANQNNNNNNAANGNSYNGVFFSTTNVNITLGTNKNEHSNKKQKLSNEPPVDQTGPKK